MAGSVAELELLHGEDNLAKEVARKWESWSSHRQEKVSEWRELRDFIFATDTTKTSNSQLPWKNSTTLPKIAQLRDNLHANYLSALFPNDDWLRWEAYSLDDADKQKRDSIQAYMSNKVRESNLRTTVSQLLYDYIDYGNAFADVEWVNESVEDPESGEIIPGYVGPKVTRLSPYDLVFNPLASSYKESPKIVRSMKTFGELKLEVAENPDQFWITDAIKASEHLRHSAQSLKREDFDKGLGYTIDGFGSIHEYFQSGLVEILQLEGTIHDPSSGDLHKDVVITVIDRMWVVRNEPNPAWMRGGYKNHVGWRLRPDNLYAMGPLDNLVGMQYRIDHLENLKADVFDLIAFPPLVAVGDVDEVAWEPGSIIEVGEGGDVRMLSPDTTALNADMQIAQLEQRMEEYAGAPKQAMGVRTPGEKTAFEVQALENAAGRIFQEKITNFEINLLEPLLNGMLELAKRKVDGSDIVRVFDDDLGVEDFLTITKEDITAKGKLRPIGARHFAAQAQMLQNIVQLSNTPVWAETAPHRSSKQLAKIVEDVLNLQRFELMQDNIGVMEQADTQRIVNQVQEDLAVEQATPVEGEEVVDEGQPPVV